MRRLTYLNSRGESVVFYHSPFLIESLTGIAEIDTDVQSAKSPYQDGKTYIDTLLEPRYINLELTIVPKSLEAIKICRQDILRVCNPKLGPGLITLEMDGDMKQIYGALDGVPIFPERGGNVHQKIMLTFFCPNPYWQDINPTNIKLEDYVSAFRFPFHFPVRFATRGDSRVLINEGHAPTPVKITFRGESINPQITKVDTGETIRIKRTIPEGYSLVITTDFDNMSANIIAPDGVITDAMGYLDLSLNWSFFSLDVGENKLSFITEGGKPDVYIEYRNLYLGV